jgi:uncharacterized protein YlbG (UPF0298 family)
MNINKLPNQKLEDLIGLTRQDITFEVIDEINSLQILTYMRELLSRYVSQRHDLKAYGLISHVNTRENYLFTRTDEEEWHELQEKLGIADYQLPAILKRQAE